VSLNSRSSQQEEGSRATRDPATQLRVDRRLLFGAFRVGRGAFHTGAAILEIARHVAIGRLILLATALVTGDPTLPSGIAGFFARPLVRGAFLMRGFSAFAGDLTLLGAVHRRETTIFLCHFALLPGATGFSDRQPGQCNRYAC
jgi:hypothetical protein